MLKKNKDGYYIIDSMDKLKEWHRLTDLSHTEKLKVKSELNKDIESIKTKSLEKQQTKEFKKKSNPKQMDGKPSSEPFIKTRKIKNKPVIKPEQTAFDKWFNN